jgi:hypothetical protein
MISPQRTQRRREVAVRRLTRSLQLARPSGLPVYVVRYPATPFPRPRFTQIFFGRGKTGIELPAFCFPSSTCGNLRNLRMIKVSVSSVCPAVELLF